MSAKTTRRSVTAALIMLMLINAVNYADRSILSILQEPIRGELGLSDFQLGLLIGPAFALFYAVMGIPVARLAERVDRTRIIIVAVTIWSAFTAACGLAQNFVQLALWRMGVGASEAGAPPASHALIADYYPRERRGRAMALFTIGLPIGLFYGNIVGSWVATHFGWRTAFFAASVPGFVLAGLCAFLLFEPRGAHAQVAAESAVQPAVGVGTLFASPAIRMLMVIALLSGFVGNAMPNYVAPFFMRVHGFTQLQAGALAAVGLGVAGFGGTLVSGWLADRFDGGRGRSYYQVPGIACFIAGILSIVAFWVPVTTAAIGIYLVSSFCGFMIVSPTFAAVQNVTDPRARATAAAMFLFCITTAGAAAPATVGFLSDMFGAAHLGLDRAQFAAACPGGKAVTTAISQAMCREGSGAGLRLALMLPCAVYIIMLPTYLFGARVARDELAARANHGETLAQG